MTVWVLPGERRDAIAPSPGKTGAGQPGALGLRSLR
jgi:hypothetical protein